MVARIAGMDAISNKACANGAAQMVGVVDKIGKEMDVMGHLGDLDTTIVTTREGNFRRSEASVVDEIEVFEGKDNSLAMYQTYTKSFQCQYYLQRYPFDTQVQISTITKVTHLF